MVSGRPGLGFRGNVPGCLSWYFPDLRHTSCIQGKNDGETMPTYSGLAGRRIILLQKETHSMQGTMSPTTGATPPRRHRTTGNTYINVGPWERLASGTGGGALMLLGLRRGGLLGMTLAAAGGSLVYRGATGHCHL